MKTRAFLFDNNLLPLPADDCQRHILGEQKSGKVISRACVELIVFASLSGNV